jgi:glycosyltransferase involved in cell wall biosynthesis
MKIAIYHNLPSGGAKRALFEWTRRLAANHVIDVYTLRDSEHAFCDIRPFVENHFEFEFKPNKLFASPLGRLNQLQRLRNLRQLSKLSKSISTTIDVKNYDVVFVNTCKYSSIPILLQYLKTTSVYYLHEAFGPTYIRHVERPYHRPRLFRVILDCVDPLIWLYNHSLKVHQEYSVKSTNLILANSIFTKDIMSAGYNIETPVAYYGVDTDGFYPIPGIMKEDYLLSVSELSPRKGFDFLIKSLGYVPASQRLELRLACNRVDPLEKEYIQNLAIQNGVNLKILTNLGTEELHDLYNRAQLLLYSPVLEPFGLVPLESMACGTPVVGVREGGVQESVLHQVTGLLIERDPVFFAEAITSLLADEERRVRYGRQSREYVLNKWTWDASTLALEQILTGCARENSSANQNIPGQSLVRT